MDFYHLKKNIKRHLLNTGLNASKKLVPKAGGFLENKIADAETKSNDDNTH